MSRFDDIMGSHGTPVLMDMLERDVTYRPAAGGTLSITAMVAIDRPDIVDSERHVDDLREGVMVVTNAAVGGVVSPDLDDKVDIGGDRYDIVTFKAAGSSWEMSIRRSVSLRIGADRMRRPRI